METTESTPATAAARAGARRHPADDRFEWPVYGYTKARTHHLPLGRHAAPALPPGVGVPRQGAARVRARPVQAQDLPPEEQRGPLRALAAHRQAALEAQARRARRGVAGLQPRRRLRRDPRAHARLERRARRRGDHEAPARRCGRASSPAAPSPRRCSTAAGCSSAPRTGRSSRCAPPTATSSGPTRPRARSRARSRSTPASSTSATTAARSTRSAARTARRSGRSNAAKGGLLGVGEGNFYSSAAVAYGRVYIGSTNGDVYSLAATNGKLAWRKRTGDYVYASPAVGKVGSGPATVYVGSYDGRLLRARRPHAASRAGCARWARRSPGAATIVGDLVFVSDLDLHTTWALGAQTGATVWKTRRGGFNPVISDGRRIYFAGFSSLFALDHEGRPFDARKRPRETTSSARPATTSAQRRAARSARRRAAPRARPRARGARRARRDRARAARAAASRARARAPASASASCAPRRTATATRRAGASRRRAAIATSTSTRCAARRSCSSTTTATRTSARR